MLYFTSFEFKLLTLLNLPINYLKEEIDYF